MLPMELLNNQEPSLTAPQVAPNIFDQLGLVLCPVSADGIALDVLVQKLVRIQFRAVARQKKTVGPRLKKRNKKQSCGQFFHVRLP